MENFRRLRSRPGIVQRLCPKLITPVRKASPKFWRRLWHKIRPVQKLPPETSPRVFPTPPQALTHVSSPSCHGVPYNRVSMLMDVDYFRGNTNPDGITQNGGWEILRLLNPDPSSHGSSSNDQLDMFMVQRQTSPTPCLPNFAFVHNPELPFAVTVAIGLRDLASAMLSQNAGSLVAYIPASPTNSTSRGLSPNGGDECTLTSRAHMVSWNNLPRSLELFLTPPHSHSLDSLLSSSNSATSSRRYHLSSLESSIGSFSVKQFRSHWFNVRRWIREEPHGKQFSPDPQLTIPECSSSSYFGSIDGDSGSSWGQCGTESSNCSGSASPKYARIARSFFHIGRRPDRSRGFFVSVDSLPAMSLVLEAGAAARCRRGM